jgi:hypothetical protein
VIDLAPGVYILALRSGFHTLAEHAITPGGTTVHFIFTREGASAILTQLGADADAYLGAISPEDFYASLDEYKASLSRIRQTAARPA